MRKHRAWVSARRAAVHLIREDLGLRPGQGLPDLVAAIEHRRGRSIHIAHVMLPPQVSGFCIMGSDHDTICVTANTSERQALHILLHELYHLLKGAPAEDCEYVITGHDLIDAHTLEEQLPSLPPGLAHEVLSRPVQQRTGYEETDEWRAEVFATMGLELLALDRSGDAERGLTFSFANRRDT
ncbi:hypothetical protein AB0I84_23255 [Streptomyces spectabilis]|uniref:hypothetical protein n=1 Tax=Streptomyces spectabilis TaxID=68270 RepID=UPI0033C5CE58